MKPVRILVADDHEVVRRGARALLEAEEGMEVCAEAMNGREAVEKAKRLLPDVVILDIGMKELNGLDAARQIRKVAPQSEVLILTIHESEEVVRQVFASGARGYVLKSDAGRDLIAAVHALRKHKPFFTSSVAEIVLGGYLQSAGGTGEAIIEPPDRLTQREREILQLLAEGRSNKEVASTLGVSAKTIETHRRNIMRKLGLHSTSELVRYAVRNKLIEP